MSPSYFVPGHISCIFQPVPSLDPDLEGSRGVGIRLDVGSTARAEYRDDHLVRIIMDGEDVYAPVTRLAVNRMLPATGLDIFVDNDLPVGHGFATSASGSLAVMLCLAEMTGKDERTAVEVAHWAEVQEKGGLGDVAAITSGEQIPVRTAPGLPPVGRVEGAPFGLEKLSVAVMGEVLPTHSVLEDWELSERISKAGRRYTDMFIEDPTRENLFEYSYQFGKETGLVPGDMAAVIEKLRSAGYGAGMCMLGYSIFTDAPADVLKGLVGEDCGVFACSSGGTGITRRE